MKHQPASGTNPGLNAHAMLALPTVVFELTDGQGSSRSRVSLHLTEAGAQRTAEKIFKTYDEFRDDPETEALYACVIWERDRQGRFGTERGLFGRYTDNSFFSIRPIAVEP